MVTPLPDLDKSLRENLRSCFNRRFDKIFLKLTETLCDAGFDVHVIQDLFQEDKNKFYIYVVEGGVLRLPYIIDLSGKLKKNKPILQQGDEECIKALQKILQNTDLFFTEYLYVPIEKLRDDVVKQSSPALNIIPGTEGSSNHVPQLEMSTASNYQPMLENCPKMADIAATQKKTISRKSVQKYYNEVETTAVNCCEDEGNINMTVTTEETSNDMGSQEKFNDNWRDKIEALEITGVIVPGGKQSQTLGRLEENGQELEKGEEELNGRWFENSQSWMDISRTAMWERKRRKESIRFYEGQTVKSIMERRGEQMDLASPAQNNENHWMNTSTSDNMTPSPPIGLPQRDPNLPTSSRYLGKYEPYIPNIKTRFSGENHRKRSSEFDGEMEPTIKRAVGRPRDDLEGKVGRLEKEIEELNQEIEERQKTGLPPDEQLTQQQTVPETTERPRNDLEFPVVPNCAEIHEDNLNVLKINTSQKRGVGRPRDDLEERIRNAEEEIEELNQEIEERRKRGLPSDEGLTQQLAEAKKERNRAKNALSKRKVYENKKKQEIKKDMITAKNASSQQMPQVKVRERRKEEEENKKVPHSCVSDKKIINTKLDLKNENCQKSVENIIKESHEHRVEMQKIAQETTLCDEEKKIVNEMERQKNHLCERLDDKELIPKTIDEPKENVFVFFKKHPLWLENYEQFLIHLPVYEQHLQDSIFVRMKIEEPKKTEYPKEDLLRREEEAHEEWKKYSLNNDKEEQKEKELKERYDKIVIMNRQAKSKQLQQEQIYLRRMLAYENLCRRREEVHKKIYETIKKIKSVKEDCEERMPLLNAVRKLAEFVKRAELQDFKRPNVGERTSKNAVRIARHREKQREYLAACHSEMESWASLDCIVTKISAIWKDVCHGISTKTNDEMEKIEESNNEVEENVENDPKNQPKNCLPRLESSFLSTEIKGNSDKGLSSNHTKFVYQKRRGRPRDDLETRITTAMEEIKKIIVAPRENETIEEVNTYKKNDLDKWKAELLRCKNAQSKRKNYKKKEKIEVAKILCDFQAC